MNKDTLPINSASPQEKTLSLKEQRENRVLSLNDVFTVTRISILNLQALENGQFEKLPPPIYTRNFITKYAQTIGIDEKPLQERYTAYLATAIEPAEERRKIQKPWPANGMKYWFLYGSLLLLLAIGIIVLVIFFYDGNGGKRASSSLPVVQNTPSGPALSPVKNPPSPPPEVQTAVLPQKPETAAGTAPEKDTAPVPAKSVPDRYHLSIKANELTWIRIIIDKTNSSEIMLKPGERIEREAAKGFRLVIGNAGGVDVSFQRQPLGFLGKLGEVVVIDLPPAHEKKTVD